MHFWEILVIDTDNNETILFVKLLTAYLTKGQFVLQSNFKMLVNKNLGKMLLNLSCYEIVCLLTNIATL